MAETEDLQQQLAQARMVISHLASQVDHHRNVQNQLTGLSLCTCLLNLVTWTGSVFCCHDEVCHVFMHQDWCHTHMKLLYVHRAVGTCLVLEYHACTVHTELLPTVYVAVLHCQIQQSELLCEAGHTCNSHFAWVSKALHQALAHI